jgi:hypothetical protein
MTETHTTAINIPPLNDIEVEVQVDFDYDMENDGIGAYEFHGQKSFDKGSDYPSFNFFESQMYPFDVETDVVRHLRPLNLSRRRFRKFKRQLVRAVELYLAKCDPAKHISEDDCIESLH